MPFNSIGDLASGLLLNQSNLQAKRNMLRLSKELTTGVTSDVGATLRNDFSQQMSWEHRIGSSQIREKTLSEALTNIQVKQSVLGAIGDSVLALSNDIALTLGSGTSIAIDAVAANAKDVFNQVVSRLNVQSGGKSLFSGARNDKQAIASVQDILTSVKSALGSTATVSDVIDEVQSWMNDPLSGFSSHGYLGGNEDAAAIRVGANRLIDESTRADDPALRATVQNLILASLSVDQDLALSISNKAALLKVAADGLRSAEGQIIGLRTSVGYVEAEVTKGKVAAGAEIATAELLRANTLGIDEYEVASKLQQAELQLEKIYTLTARSARMSLLEYLR